MPSCVLCLVTEALSGAPGQSVRLVHREHAACGLLLSEIAPLKSMQFGGVYQPRQGCVPCRLEQEPNVRNEAALQRFDARLLKSMKALQQDGWWEELVNAGGSPVPILQLGSSRPKVEVGVGF